MSKSTDHVSTLDGSAVRNTTGKGIKQTLDGPPGFMPDDKHREFCDKHYNQLLPLMAKKVHQEKLQGHEDPGPSLRRSPVSTHVFTRLRETERNVFTWLGNKEPDVFSRLGSKDLSRYGHANSRRHAMEGNEKSEKDGMQLTEPTAERLLRISGFMHGITNLVISKRLNDNIPESVDEMMNATTTFLKGEVAIANQSRKKGRRHDNFTLLTKTPREILTMDDVKFKAPSPMSIFTKNQKKNKLCELHSDKGHNIDECIYLKKQIEEAVKSGHLAHLVKEIKQGSTKGDHPKITKKGEATGKEKAS
nr:hypothetical protein [Tanacetum cinerariifolium]